MNVAAWEWALKKTSVRIPVCPCVREGEGSLYYIDFRYAHCFLLLSCKCQLFLGVVLRPAGRLNFPASFAVTDDHVTTFTPHGCTAYVLLNWFNHFACLQCPFYISISRKGTGIKTAGALAPSGWQSPHKSTGQKRPALEHDNKAFY